VLRFQRARVFWAQEFICTPLGSHLRSLMRVDVARRNRAQALVFREFRSFDPTSWWTNPARIWHTRAPSVSAGGQPELFARRARSEAHPGALNELQMTRVT